MPLPVGLRSYVLFGATGGGRTRTLSLEGFHAAVEHHGRSKTLCSGFQTNALPGFSGTLYLLSYRSTCNLVPAPKLTGRRTSDEAGWDDRVCQLRHAGTWYRRVDSNHHQLGFKPSMSASCITPARTGVAGRIRTFSARFCESGVTARHGPPSPRPLHDLGGG